MNSEGLNGIVSKFSGKRLLVIGDGTIDRYVYGDVRRLNPESPVPLLDAKDSDEMTGGAGNAAKNLAGLGASVSLVTVVGADNDASTFSVLAKEEGYDVVQITDTSRPTIRKSRYLAGGHQLLRVDEEKKHEVTDEVEKEVIAAIENAAVGVDAILVSDYAKGVITKAVATAIMTAAKEHSIPVIADLKASHTDLFVGVSAITPNKKEAHEFLGIDGLDDEREPQELAQLLQEKLQCDVFVTLSGDGVYVLAQEGEGLHVKQEHKVEVSDVSGAGDTVAAVLALAYASDVAPHEAAVLANAAGAVVVEKVGSVGLSQEELLSMIEHDHV